MLILRLTLVILLLPVANAFAQLPGTPQVPGTPLLPGNTPQRDTTKRAPTKNWHDEPVSIYALRPFSTDTIQLPDTGIHMFHRRPFSQPWLRDLGNLGAPARSLLFVPDQYGHIGPRLGYQSTQHYRYHPDSLLHYNTTRPYTSFQYGLGSKLEQLAQVAHTQNINPRWNFAARYTKLTSPGAYRIQRNNQDHGALTTWYTGPAQHYEFAAAIVYNLEQVDENGGLIGNDSLFADPRFGDPRTLPIRFQNDAYSATRSSVTNNFRQAGMTIRHRYAFGRTDTTWSADSTQFSAHLVPRFSIGHRLSIGSDKLIFRHMRADSVLWSSFFTEGLNRARTDSVMMTQRESWVDNLVTLEGFIGRAESPVRAWAGAGSRNGALTTDYPGGGVRTGITQLYLDGGLALDAQQSPWAFGAQGRFILSGPGIGNFFVDGHAARSLRGFGAVRVRFRQDLRQPGYCYEEYRNAYFTQSANLRNESITMAEGAITLARLNLEIAARTYLIGNMAYLAAPGNGISAGRLDVSQSGAFNLTQISARKSFRFGAFVLDNELAYQQRAGDAPVNVPALLGRHQASAELPLFARALMVATGVEVRYHTPYKPAGYAPFYARFYYQDAYTLRNKPELTAFFNFRVKRFRAYLAGDQLQQLWWPNNLATYGYGLQNFMIRFGFDWVMVN